MSQTFVTVQWNRRKYVYDAILVAGIVAYLFLFQAISRTVLAGAQAISGETLGMRAWGSCAFLMLTAILCIGPLARLNPRFLPLLYNRRHFGVIFFFVAVNHARQVLDFYHAYGNISKIESLLTHDAAFTQASVPFQLLGAAALTIFFVMVATSHDFWQKVLSGRHWKALHMSVYVGYALVVAHVAFGALQFETSAWLTAAVAISVALVGTLHLTASLGSTRPDRRRVGQIVDHDGSRWISAGPAAAMTPNRAHNVTTPSGESLAVVRNGNEISAVHGVCAHQGGPLAEGRVLDGCLTCPWHGWQYRPADGQSPPPFTEKIPTHRVRLDERGHLLVELTAQPPGTSCEPVTIVAAPTDSSVDSSAAAKKDDEFFVGYLRTDPHLARFSLGAAASMAAAILLFGTVFAAFQRNPGERLQPGEYGVRHAGLLLEKPYPHLRTLNADGTFTTMLFTGWVKNNVNLPAGKIGQPVHVQGNLYARAGLRMLEGAGGFEAASDVAPADLERLQSVPSEDLGEVTLRGEIVDSKCYAGRMRPGVGHAHRACAQLCILGGIPPVLVTFEADGSEIQYVLASMHGEPVNTAVAPFAAEPVEVKGHLVRRGDLRILQIDPAEIRRR